MATPQGMSGIDLLAMVEELRQCLPLWIGKIYQFDEKSIGIRLGGEQEKHQLFIEAGKRAHLVLSLPAAPTNPTGFAMLLRKHLLGGRVLSIGQFGIQRIFFLEIGKREQTFRLIIELFDEGNVILCREDGTIVMPLWHHRFRDRELVRDAPYVVTGTDCMHYSREEFVAAFQNQEKSLVKALAVECMLGGAYAEEVCRMAGMDKSIPAHASDLDGVYSAIQDLLIRVRERRTPVITSSGCWPIVLDEEVPLERFSTYQAALGSFYPILSRKEAKAAAKPSRAETIRNRQLRAISGFEEKIARIQAKIDAIYAHYTLVEEMIRTLQAASTIHSWQEIEQRLKGSDQDAAKKVIRVYPEEGAVELDLGDRVKILVDQSLEGNVNQYYEQIKKLKRKRTGALAAVEQPIEKKKLPRSPVPVVRRRWYHRFRWFFTSDDVLVVGGKDADQNEELVKKYLEGGDMFVHADVHGASVVVVKGSTQHLDEAAQFAVSYSGAWKSGQFSGDAYAARPEQVSKTPPSGEYVAKGSFMVRGERTYLRNIPLAVAIGVQTAPEIQVIGGPPAPVKARATLWVELEPGTFEPNDIARKAVRRLKEMAEKKGIFDVARVVTTEAVAAFIPPGGSDLVGVNEG